MTTKVQTKKDEFLTQFAELNAHIESALEMHDFERARQLILRVGECFTILQAPLCLTVTRCSLTRWKNARPTMRELLPRSTQK